MRLVIPELSLVVLIGPSGSGKSTFARRHFKPTEVLSSDTYRGLVSDDENDQTATEDAFDALYYVARKRLAAGRLTVLDATNVQVESRKKAVAVAREFDRLPIAIVFDLSEDVCNERNRARPDRDWNPYLAGTQRQQFLRGMQGLQKEGFREVYVLSSVQEVEAAAVVREPL
jgi:protein phosphatase